MLRTYGAIAVILICRKPAWCRSEEFREAASISGYLQRALISHND